jgi:hypothetical protein
VFQLRIWNRLFPWMNGPLLGYVTSFWIGLIEDGPRDMLTPRWGGITFGWLNDGFSPTIWHTWQQVMHPRGKYNGIYLKGAPRNRQEADNYQ